MIVIWCHRKVWMRIGITRRIKVVWRHGWMHNCSITNASRVSKNACGFLIFRLLRRHATESLHEFHVLNCVLDHFFLADLVELPLNGGIPVILNIIITSSGQFLGNTGPFVSIRFVHPNENGFFLLTPFTLFPLGI